MKVYTGGTFDLFHKGHVDLLQQCHRLSGTDEVVVALNTDEFVEEFKGRAPVVPFEERKAVLESCRFVSEVVVNSGGRDSRPTIEAVRPDIIAIGSDWAPPRNYHDQMNFTQAWLDERNILLVFVPRRVDGPSTTKIKQAVLEKSGRPVI